MSKEDDEEFTVRNLDTGEVLGVTDMTSQLNISALDAKQAQTGEGIDDEEEYNYDAKMESLNFAQAKDDGLYRPLEVPQGSRLIFERVSAAGTAKDLDGKAYTFYYIDVSCATATPAHWTVYRRYNEFRRLSDLLRSDGCYSPILPPRKPLLCTMDIMIIIKSRTTTLETWLYNLLVYYDPGAKDPQKNASFRDFLTDDANRPPYPLVQVYPEHLDTNSDSKAVLVSR